MELLGLDGLERFFSRKRRRHYSLDYYDTSSSSDDSDFDDLLGTPDVYRSDTESNPIASLLRKDSPSGSKSDDAKSVEPRQASTLLDIAAAVTAEHYSCEQLESNELPLDEAVLKKIAFWAFPQDVSQVKIFACLSLQKEEEWRKGESIVQEGRIREMRQVGFMVSAIIFKKVTNPTATKEDSKVSLTFERQRITSSTCATCPNCIWCQHIVAAIIYRIQNADKIPCHAPVTEVLSTLTRDQLQKIVQYAINEDPGGVLGKVFQHIDDYNKTPLKPGSNCHTDKNTLDSTENNLSTQEQIEESELETNEDPEEVVEDIYKDMNETENIEDVLFVEFTNDKIFLAVLADNKITYTKRPYIYGTPSISKTINYSLESEKYDYNHKYIVGKIPSSLLKKSKGGVVIVNLQKVQKSFEEHFNAYLKIRIENHLVRLFWKKYLCKIGLNL